jgi:hypothetical protein
LIQIKVDVEQMKSGRVAIELLVGKSAKRPATKMEMKVASNLKMMMAILISDVASNTPGSTLAVGAEDVETLKGMENLDLEKGETDA